MTSGRRTRLVEQPRPDHSRVLATAPGAIPSPAPLAPLHYRTLSQPPSFRLDRPAGERCALPRPFALSSAVPDHHGWRAHARRRQPAATARVRAPRAAPSATPLSAARHHGTGPRAVFTTLSSPRRYLLRHLGVRGEAPPPLGASRGVWPALEAISASYSLPSLCSSLITLPSAPARRCTPAAFCAHQPTGHASARPWQVLYRFGHRQRPRSRPARLETDGRGACPSRAECMLGRGPARDCRPRGCRVGHQVSRACGGRGRMHDLIAAVVLMVT
jgi:hypothetical protein